MKKVARQGEFVPPAIQSKPDLSQFEQPFYNAYNALSGSRNFTSVGPAPIPMSEILKYLSEHLQIDDIDEREEYIFMILGLDSTYLEWHNKKR